MSASKKKIKVAIIGGGIGGLSLAAGLVKQAHIDVHVYESVPEYKDIGAGLALHMNAIKAMDLIGPHVKKAYFDKALAMAEEAEEEMSTQVSIASGPNTGAVVAELGKAKGRKTVARSDLLAGLKALIPSHRLHFNKRLASINERPDDSVDITFKDGTKKHVDCLIACDGVHSTVRSYLLGADHPATSPKNHDGWQIYRTMIPSSEARKHIDEKYTRTVPIMCGPKGHINCMPLHHGRDISAGVAVRGARTQDQTTTPLLRIEDFSSYTPDAQAIIRLIAKDTSFSWAISDHDHAPFYSRRRICLAGDAAHTSLPFAGQGAAQAIEDAAVLSALFRELAPPTASTPPSPTRRDSASSFSSFSSDAEDDDHPSSSSTSLLPHLLAAYDATRRPRSQKVVEIARDFGRLYAFAMPGYGDDPDKMRGFFGKMAAFTNNADLQGQNEEARRRFRELVSMEEGGWLRTRDGGVEEKAQRDAEGERRRLDEAVVMPGGMDKRAEGEFVKDQVASQASVAA
ncbi:FAD-binding domain-containing protein 13 [Elsinoe fawcettii]|nr:FAD-binding domain-containing protein 13 [Elsinoe fawcettii]